mmetsp:Transcript_3227/g.7586  ORF Transcript_3227/g.7586 Transcript_3227/m.7586 type:complete len:263 (-) Transcript_3227:265-1053(-)|eukprot:1365628-Rhodomonas_salina.2
MTRSDCACIVFRTSAIVLPLNPCPLTIRTMSPTRSTPRARLSFPILSTFIRPGPPRASSSPHLSTRKLSSGPRAARGPCNSDRVDAMAAACSTTAPTMSPAACSLSLTRSGGATEGPSSTSCTAGSGGVEVRGAVLSSTRKVWCRSPSRRITWTTDCSRRSNSKTCAIFIPRNPFPSTATISSPSRILPDTKLSGLMLVTLRHPGDPLPSTIPHRSMTCFNPLGVPGPVPAPSFGVDAPRTLHIPSIALARILFGLALNRRR